MALIAFHFGFSAVSAQAPSIAFVQANYSAPQTSQLSVSVPYPAAQTAGNLNVVVVGWNDSTAHVQTIGDTQGNIYTLAIGPTVISGVATQSIYFAKNIRAAAAGGNAVTVTFDQAAQFVDIRTAEYRGLDLVNPLDVAVAGTGNNSTSNSGQRTTSNANDLLVGANLVQTSTTGPGSGYTQRLLTDPDADILEDRIVTTTGNYNATAPLKPAGRWIMQMVAFRAASGTGGGDSQPPTAPSNLTAAAASSTQINLSWTASTDNVGVTNYLIERCQGAGCSNFAQIATSPTATFNNTGLAPTTSYSYRVRATDAANNLGGYSNVATATTQTETQPPTAPSNLIATAASSTQINLTWTASTDNVAVTNYLIERCLGAGCTNFAQVATSTTPSFSDPGLLAAMSYSYRVRATDAANNLSGYSNTASATTLTQAPPSAITLIQHTGTDAGTTTSSSLAFPLPTTAGNWIAVLIRAGQPGQVLTVTDSRGNTYHRAVQFNETSDGTTLGVFYAESIAGGTNTVTVSDTIAGGTLRFAIFEYSGLASTNSLDVTTAAQGTSASPNSGPVTPTTNGELLIGLVSTANAATVTAGSGYVVQERVPAAPSTKLVVEDATQAVAGPVALSATLGAVDQWGAALAAFRPGVGVPPPPSDLTVTKTHPSAFFQGQTGATYTLTVNNIGGPTNGAVTLSDTLPGGLTATAMAGTGWSCTLGTLSCTRSDSLAASASYPAVTLTVDVALTAPASVTNTAIVNGGSEGNTSNNTANDVTPVSPATDSVPPTAPGTLTALAQSGTRVDLQWGAAQDNVGVTGYRVERCQGAGCSDFVKLATPTGTTFTDTALTPNTSYSYFVRATDAAGNLGPPSNTATVVTLSTIPELVAAYSFDESGGSTVTDVSGHGNTGTIVNATRTTSGKYGSALTFNGTNARVTISDNPSLRLTTAMTLEAWVMPTTISNAWRDVIFKGDDNYFLEGTSNQGGVPAGGGTFADGTLFASSALPVNVWTHLTLTYDSSTLRLYVNGVEVSNAAVTRSIATSTNPLEIGGDSIYGQFFQGSIDDVRIYNVALTPTQIQSDMSIPTSGGSPLPFVSLNPSSLNFGNQATGTTSSALVSTLTNTGGAALSIGSITLSGPQSADFAQTLTCGSTLAPGANCTISVKFTPAATGTRSATVSISDNAPGSPHTIALTGVGTGFSISPGTVVLTPGRTQQFTTTSGGGGATWSVDGVVGGTASSGTITSTGLYTAPSSGGTHTVTVTAQAQTSNATVYISTSAGVFTHHNDNFRTGQNLNEIALTPATVNAATFGKLQSFAVDGMVMASPLYASNVSIPGQGIRNVVYVATQHDSVYAFDADGGSSSALWQRSFISPPNIIAVPSDDTQECCDIAPEIGITGTPVIDPATGTLYVVAKTKEGNNYFQRLHALDITNGAERFGGPVTLQASVTGNGAGSQGNQVAFNPLRENQRPALLLSNGVVYIAFGSHGDNQPYHGWVLGYNANTLQRVFVHNVSPNGEGGGIWQANGGPAADAAGNIYFITGDGTFDANTGGTSYGDTFVKISPSGVVQDYFTPHDQGNLNASNFDLGAAGPLLLPDQTGSSHPHLLVSAGKNKDIYLVDRDNMGHYNPNNDSQIVQSLVDIFDFGTPEPGNYSAPVYFNGTVYFGPIADNIRGFPLAGGILTTPTTMRSTEIYKYPGASMAISANGSTNGILWAVQRNGDCGVAATCGSAAPGVLHAYDATDIRVHLYGSDQMGTRDTLDFAAKFSVPVVANGKVFVGSAGRLTIYGLLP